MRLLLGTPVDVLKGCNVETTGDLASLLALLEDFSASFLQPTMRALPDSRVSHAPTAAMAIDLWAEKRAKLESGEVDAGECGDWKALLQWSKSAQSN